MNKDNAAMPMLCFKKMAHRDVSSSIVCCNQPPVM